MKKLLFVIMLMVTSYNVFAQGFLHQDGQNIVDGNGNNVLLRGLGLGGWMVQEGYMLQTDGFAGSQHEIRAKIKGLIGAENTEAFYQAYRDNGITKRDIDSLKAWGFNSVRLPMHYNLYTLPIEQEPVAGQNTWLDEGFERTDQLLQWCAANEMYLILDMHAAPGGQGKDANISDYDPSKPSLWESAANRQKMVALWHELAVRYKDSPWIGAYDLINEPNWAFTGSNQNGCDENSNGPLRNLMIDITESIREVDNNHMIIIEGNCWGNNYNGIFPLWDDNMTVSFHKYWNQNDQGSIQGLLDIRAQHNVPLWLGESGENSNVWFRDAISLVESLNIGWAFWPMKKIGSIAGVTTVQKTPEYQQLLDYWNNGGTQPTESFATAALMQMAESYKMQNVTVNRNVIDAMFRQVQTFETKAYTNNELPGKIYATEFDLGTNNYAYKDNDVATYHSGGGEYTAWNQGWSMRNDGVDIQTTNDAGSNGYIVSFIAPNEWLLFTIPSDEAMAYDIDIRYAGTNGKLHIEDATGRISQTISLPSTGSYTTWSTITLNDVIVKQGENKIKVYFETGGFNLSYLQFKNPVAPESIALSVIDAGTNVLGDEITVTFNKSLAAGIDFDASNLTLKLNGNPVGIDDIVMSDTGNKFIISPATPVSQGDVITMSYAGSNLIATDATVQAVFTDMPVANRVGNIQTISGLIQAESFYVNNGLALEDTTDSGGGQNIGYTDAGDYLDYLVNINEAGNYKIEYRTSGQSQTGQVTLQLINNDVVQDIQTVSFPPTGGWQTWVTTAAQAELPQGRYYLRILITAPGFNLNWVKFSLMAPDDDNDGVSNDLDQCPDTPAGDVVDFNGCTIFTLPGNNFSIAVTNETCRTSNNGSVVINAVANHNYTATLTAEGYNQSSDFTANTTFGNLQAGSYQLCITLPEESGYQQCFDMTITEPQDLAVLSRVRNDEYEVEVDLYGADEYFITLNNATYTTTQNTIVLPLKPGTNNLEVKTAKECQGTYRKSIVMDNTILLYPNPVNSDMLFAAVPEADGAKVYVEIFTIQGKRILAQEYSPQDRVVGINTSSIAQGVYIVKVVCGSSVFNSKIIKE
ncbi:carbohydrate-binding protein [Flavobacterium rhizosphaerae]|uniref:Carbohydrate-binding protein n=1 Tax=Flavobacterium rhizosphaerae TaxID=3163298 RepID=A0ABW8Z0G3_9FLAO